MFLLDFFNKFKTYIIVVVVILTFFFIISLTNHFGDMLTRFFGGETKESLQKENANLRQGLDVYQSANQSLYDLNKTEGKVDRLSDSLYKEHKTSQKEMLDKIAKAKQKFEKKKTVIQKSVETKKTTPEEIDRQRAINQYQLISDTIKATRHE